MGSSSELVDVLSRGLAPRAVGVYGAARAVLRATVLKGLVPGVIHKAGKRLVHVDV